MKRSDRQINMELDALQAQAKRKDHPYWLDEFSNVPYTNNELSGYTALTIFLAPLFIPLPMLAHALVTSLGNVAGPHIYRLALYKALQTDLKNRHHARLNEVATGFFSGDTVQWKRVALGPDKTATSQVRYLWQFDKDIQIRPPDIYGVAFMANSDDATYRGGTATALVYSAFADPMTRSTLEDFPDTLNISQGTGNALPAPCFVLRSARALGRYPA